jgi:hypothetical protein
MLIAIGIAVVLVVAAIDRLAARVMMGPEEMALLRLARAAAAQRRLVALSGTFTDISNDQLVQAMAGFGGDAADDSNSVFLGDDTSQ